MKKIAEGNMQKKNDDSPPGMPRWVKVFVTIGLVLVFGFVILHLSGHSPFMHMHHMGSGGQNQ